MNLMFSNKQDESTEHASHFLNLFEQHFTLILIRVRALVFTLALTKIITNLVSV